MSWTVSSIVASLIEMDENERIEAKTGLGNASMKTVSSFSNETGLRGGWIVFGVTRKDENHYEYTGVADPDALQAELATRCRGSFNRILHPTLRVDIIEGQRIVVAYIPEAHPADKPVYLKKMGLPKGAFRRVGSVDQTVTDDDLARFALLANEVPYEQRILQGSHRDDIDPLAITAYRRQLRETRPASELLELNDNDLLLAIQALKSSQADELVPTLLGLLLFGTKLAIRKYLPMQRVDVLVSDGSSLTDNYQVTEIQEALVTGWRKVFSSLRETLPLRVSLPDDSLLREESPRIPDVVLREAIINALMHQDLSVSSPVQLHRLADRVEVHNPGHSLLNEEYWGSMRSQARNPSLAAVFHDLGLAESRGTGMRRMRERMRLAGMSEPEFVSDRAGNHFQLTLRFQHLLDEADWQWLSQFPELEDTDQQILMFVLEQGTIRNEDVRALSSDGVLGASRRLSRLRDKGILEQHGNNKQQTWYSLSNSAQPSNLRTNLPTSDSKPSNLKHQTFQPQAPNLPTSPFYPQS